jgi:hypothetical protein
VFGGSDPDKSEENVAHHVTTVSIWSSRCCINIAATKQKNWI